MKLVKLFKIIRWTSKISFLILFFLERHYYSEGLPTNESNVIKYFKIAFLVIFIIASLVENKLIIRGKNKEIKTLKRQLNEKT